MNLLSLLAFTVYAAETIVSPLPDTVITPLQNTQKPSTSFSELVVTTPTVLGAHIDMATPTPIPIRKTKRSAYTIALLGDSMIDTLGPEFPALHTTLARLYPQTTFTIKNFGVGGTNIDYGIERLTHDYTYLGTSISTLVSHRPDIVIVESFGYNPYSFDTGALEKHWLALATIVDTIKIHLPDTQVVLAATIAPDAKTFGDGAPGISFDPIAKQEKVTVIKSYLENIIKFAQSQHIPYVDAYHASLDSTGNGKDMYINAGDHIHYSDAGRQLFAQKVGELLESTQLLE